MRFFCLFDTFVRKICIYENFFVPLQTEIEISSKDEFNLKNIRYMATTQQNPGTLYNALTSGSKIIGTVITDSDMRVDGTIEGDVKCAGKLVIGEQGQVKGTIECQNAEIMGKIDGKIDVKYALALRATSKLQGEIKTGTLMVEPNAVFNGTCTMGDKSVEKK